MAAPEEMPTRSPFRARHGGRDRRRRTFSTLMISSMTSVSKMAGTKPAPMPWMGWGPFSPARRAPVGGGLDGHHLHRSLALLQHLADAGYGPAGPTPDTTMSTVPSVSAQISSAVVARWTAGLAGFSNCWGMK